MSIKKYFIKFSDISIDLIHAAARVKVGPLSVTLVQL